MGAMGVMKRDQRLRQVIKVAEAEANEVIKALAFEAAYPRFREGIRVGCPVGQSDDLCTNATEKLLERHRGLRVAIVQQKAWSAARGRT